MRGGYRIRNLISNAREAGKQIEASYGTLKSRISQGRNDIIIIPIRVMGLGQSLMHLKEFQFTVPDQGNADTEKAQHQID
jgi:hypothetical protein